MVAGKQIGYGLVALTMLGAGIYFYNDKMAVKKAADGGCGCTKKVKKSAPPADEQVIQEGGCEGCGPKVAVYNPLYIHPMFDPNEYQMQSLNNMGQPENPYSYHPYSPMKRTLLVSNLGGGI
tara:strand:+ start:5726 stop:6091 length:366 start_codon:yes stop_codon:yes gene_type:complete